MCPAFEVGQTLWISPQLPPRSTPTSCCGKPPALVARLAESDTHPWYLLQHNHRNKKHEFNVKREAFPTCNRIVGAFDSQP